MRLSLLLFCTYGRFNSYQAKLGWTPHYDFDGNRKYLTVPYTMESGSTMVLHAVILGLILYVVMRYVLGQRPCVAEDRSVALGAVILLYMVVFGHGLPGRVNPNIMS
jgi:hypothetical protein